VNPHDFADRATVAAYPAGYCPDTRPFLDWRAAGLLCAFAHCVETQPLTGGPAECPVFGHDCPAGADVAQACALCEAFGFAGVVSVDGDVAVAVPAADGDPVQ